MWFRNKLTLHHRAVWTILVGEIPNGAMLCHHCDNPQCANPLHMYVGDAKSNVHDMVSRGRHWLQTNKTRAAIIGRRLGSGNDWAKGMNNPKAKLSSGEVERIRLSKLPTKTLATEYGVDRTTVQRIRRGALWPTPRALQQKGSSNG